MRRAGRRSTLDIKAVIWDMGGVIVRTEDRASREAWEQRLDLPIGRLDQEVFESPESHQASVGEATADEVWRGVAERHGLDSEQRAQLERDFWAGDLVDEGLVDVIRGLQSQYTTALLSNAWPDVREVIENQWGFADAFEEIVISAEVGMVKPNPKIYQLTLRRLQVHPEHAVFIDDFEKNVEGARAVGLHAIRFRTKQQTLRELFDLLGQQVED
ncbi:MAG: HAD family phosphatase [Anaerolineales bacterium]|nr:HAD family phosphatase [Anaerolineales bacterium]